MGHVRRPPPKTPGEKYKWTLELRFFGGMTEKEIGEIVGVSVATVKRDWEFARSWLITQFGFP